MLNFQISIRENNWIKKYDQSKRMREKKRIEEVGQMANWKMVEINPNR